MIAWGLSKLFSTRTLCLALSLRPEVVSFDITTDLDLQGMQDAFDGLMDVPVTSSRDQYEVH